MTTNETTRTATRTTEATATTGEAVSCLAHAQDQVIQVRGKQVSRQNVLDSIAVCESVGRLAFLSDNGYGDSTRYHLRHDGRSYPSKAILGVAAGLSPADFFGGAAHTVAQLARLGFHVRNSDTGEIVDPSLDGLRRRCLSEGLDVGTTAWPESPVAPAAYFASGSNRVGEIRGLSKAGADVGVAANEISPAAEAALVELAGSDVQVFVDSGAFSEVSFGANGAEIVKPITPAGWERVLALYARLGRALGSQLWIVAPDCVGHQDITLERLALYATDVRALHASGVHVLVPVQKGELSQAAFAAKIDAALGFTSWIPAMPCKKAATTAAEVADFLTTRKPDHVHLLGLGIRSRKLEAYLAPFTDSLASVSLDSCWITANVGRTSGPKGGPRKLTAARDIAKSVTGLDGGAKVIELAIYTCLAGSGLTAK